MIHGDVLGERARLSPERTALVEVVSGRRFSFSELDRRAVGCALVWLQQLGLVPGDRLGVLSGNRVELLDCFFAAGKSGVILVPLSTRLTANELARIIADCGLSALVYASEHAATITGLREQVEIKHWISLDQPLAAADRQYEQLLAAAAGADPGALRRCDPEHPFCLLYTSGTTGQPKGVVIPHRQVAWNGYNTMACWQLSENDVSPIFTPLYHAGGLGVFLVPLIVAGGTIVLHAGFEPAEIWRTIEHERCTVVLGVPTIWKLLAAAPEMRQVDLSHVRWFISGGAPLPRHLVDLFRERGVVLRQGYGLTEVGVNCFAMSDQDAWHKAGSIGRPLMQTEARLIDEQGHEVAVGEVGELCLRGPHVCNGYWSNETATAAAIDDRHWFHTGDMARRDEDGFYYIAGRRKEMFISGGVNVYPAEIENELLQHRQVADAAVVGIPDETWGEVGVAFVVAAEGSALDGDSLSAFLEPRLARYKIPRRFVLLGELPRTPYGKVVKAALLESLDR
jgi:fatty-acyl-CoA synthase